MAKGTLTREPAWLVRLRRVRLHPDEIAGLDLLSRDAQLLHLVGREYCTWRNSPFISNHAMETVIWPRFEYLLLLPQALQPGLGTAAGTARAGAN